MPTATVARIRRCNRATEFATVQDAAVLAARPDAKPTGSDEFTIDSFFDLAPHAQAMLAEKFAVLSSSRLNEAAESQEPLGIGTDISISPLLPKVRMTDTSRGIVNRVMLIKGIAVDFQSDRNSIEAVG